MSPNLPTSFWSRMGLQEDEHNVCVRAIQSVYPRHRVEAFGEQGYCSFTLAVVPSSRDEEDAKGRKHVVQLRPRQHRLDAALVDAARKIHGNLAPRVRELDCVLPGNLSAVEMDMLSGVPLSKVDIQFAPWAKRVTLVQSFARGLAMAWPTSPEPTGSTRHTRADTPTEAQWLDEQCTGRVGHVLVSKLQKLASRLPSSGLRARARDVLERLLAMEAYPVVLNHGDLIPSNILIDAESWAVTGLVDWAEAEWLPFGTCLYGLEFLLGGPGVREGKAVWEYWEGREALERVFWGALERERPGLGARREEVMCARDVGVLLWFGYAWDEGAIDRVVTEVDDVQEVACLRAFLDVM